MGMFDVTEEDRKAALAQALIQGGFYAMAGRGNALQNVAMGGIGAMNAYNNSMAGAQDAKLNKAKAAEYEQTIVDKQAKSKRALAYANTRAGFKSDGGSSYDKALQMADYLEAQGFPEEADKQREQALKFAPQYKGLETIMQDGKPVVLQTYGNQPPTATPYSPKPEYKQVDTGSSVGFYDPVTGQGGGSFGKTMTPGEMAGNEVARGNLGVAQGQLGIARERLNLDRQKSEAEKGEKPLTEGQASSAMYYGMMKTASQDINSIKQPNTIAVAGARGDVPYVPKAVQNWAAGEDAQKYAQASLQWTEAMLRMTTGATAPPEEVLRTSKTFFPQIGDSPELIKQKNARRADMEKLAAVKAGAAGKAQVDAATAPQKAVSSQQQYDSLPSGAIYTAPDGTQRRKK